MGSFLLRSFLKVEACLNTVLVSYLKSLLTSIFKLWNAMERHTNHAISYIWLGHRSYFVVFAKKQHLFFFFSGERISMYKCYKNIQIKIRMLAQLKNDILKMSFESEA